MSSREQILARLRAQRPPFDDVPPPPTEYLPVTRLSPEEASDPAALLARFKAEVERLSGKVYTPEDSKAAVETVLRIITAAGADRVVAWEALPLAGLSAALAAQNIALIVPRPNRLSRESRREAIASIDPILVGITGAAAAFAATGTLVLPTRAGQGRIPSLVPPTHIALLRRACLFPRLEDWMKTEAVRVLNESRSVAFITGPSRTGDIEMQIILGVHGPREVHVVVIGDDCSADGVAACKSTSSST